MDRSEAARILARGRARQTVACEICGTSFETYATGKVGRYCSKPCRQKGYVRTHAEQERIRQREKNRRYRAKRRRPHPGGAGEGGE